MQSVPGTIYAVDIGSQYTAFPQYTIAAKPQAIGPASLVREPRRGRFLWAFSLTSHHDSGQVWVYGLLAGSGGHSSIVRKVSVTPSVSCPLSFTIFLVCEVFRCTWYGTYDVSFTIQQYCSIYWCSQPVKEYCQYTYTRSTYCASFTPTE